MKVYVIQSKNGIMINVGVSVKKLVIGVLVKMITRGILARVIMNAIKQLKLINI